MAKEGDFVHAEGQNLPQQFLFGIHQLSVGNSGLINIQMVKAMEAVKSGVGINTAAMECGVPCTTLKDCISSHVEHGVNSGPVPYLNKEKEKELAVFLKTSALIGKQENKSWLL